MPKNFFSLQSSIKMIPKTRSSYIFSTKNSKDICEQFKNMFKFQKNLDLIAIKFSPKQF